MTLTHLVTILTVRTIQFARQRKAHPWNVTTAGNMNASEVSMTNAAGWSIKHVSALKGRSAINTCVHLHVTIAALTTPSSWATGVLDWLKIIVQKCRTIAMPPLIVSAQMARCAPKTRRCVKIPDNRLHNLLDSFDSRDHLAQDLFYSVLDCVCGGGAVCAGTF